MCGIAGIITRDGTGPRDLSLALDLMAHRGPDGHGQWHDADAAGHGITLAHRRLSIIDLSDNASQPMGDTSGRYWLTFNGEIYNYVELKAELVARGATFRTASDSEVILEAYKAWGTACLDRFNGMFAFAIWDKRERRLFAARDRFGEKPLLYVAKPAFFAFASEYKVLLTMPGVSRGYDEFRLIRFAANPGQGCDADRQTVFRDIAQLLPGEALEIGAEEADPRVWRYYAPRYDATRAAKSETELFAEFRRLLIDSVRIRMRSDVKVGSCLSGGLDSSAIVCIARQLIGEDAPYHTFTGQFPGTDADEAHFARIVVEATGVESHHVEPTVDRFVDELPQFMWLNELPVGGASQFAQWCVFHLAKQHGVTVLLDGQGSDEVLGGYETYFRLYVAALEETGDNERLLRERPEIERRYPGVLSTRREDFKERLPFRMRHMMATRFGKGSNLFYALRADVALRVQGENARTRQAGFHALASALVEDSFGRFLTTLLRYGDRNSMAHSREVRLPFCDHRIADFVLSLPPHLLMGEAQNKRLLRESMRGILPDPIRMRWRKQGFNPPTDLWFRSPRLMELVRDMLGSESFRASPYWLTKPLSIMADRVAKGERGLGWSLWQPLQLDLWRKHFIEALPPQRDTVGALQCTVAGP